MPYMDSRDDERATDQQRKHKGKADKKNLKRIKLKKGIKLKKNTKKNIFTVVFISNLIVFFDVGF